MIRVANLALRPGETEKKLYILAAKAAGIPTDRIKDVIIRKKSIDARKKNDIRIIYTVDVVITGDEKAVIDRSRGKVTAAKYFKYTVPTVASTQEKRPVIVGFGPAGMLAALVLSMAGLKPIVLERGQDADTRAEKVAEFWRTGKLDPECNVQFGEGGAGTFSDGKLNTGISDERIAFVLQSFVEAGAQENILYDAKPHIGTDVLITVVKNLRRRIIELGGEVRFNACVESLVTDGKTLTGVRLKGGEVICTDRVILAIGHSARDTFETIYRAGIPMEPKAFSMGVRIEHKQTMVSESQYGEASKLLPPADYKLNVKFPEGDSAYTFCMCPGGYVVAAASEEGRVCTNGMSRSKRDGENANAALLVTLNPEDFPEKDVLGGIRWQREIEERAFKVGGSNYRAPAQLVGDFLAGKASTGPGEVRPTYEPGVKWCDICEVLPPRITDTLKKAIPALGKKLHGFDDPSAVITAPETRSSSPVRILRDENRESTLRGLYPCGEGAGYAGGIVSAAVDGMKCAEAVIASYE